MLRCVALRRAKDALKKIVRELECDPVFAKAKCARKFFRQLFVPCCSQRAAKLAAKMAR